MTDDAEKYSKMPHIFHYNGLACELPSMLYILESFRLLMLSTVIDVQRCELPSGSYCWHLAYKALFHVGLLDIGYTGPPDHFQFPKSNSSSSLSFTLTHVKRRNIKSKPIISAPKICPSRKFHENSSTTVRVTVLSDGRKIHWHVFIFIRTSYDLLGEVLRKSLIVLIVNFFPRIPTMVIVYTIHSLLKPLHTVLTASEKDNIIIPAL